MMRTALLVQRALFMRHGISGYLSSPWFLDDVFVSIRGNLYLNFSATACR